MSTDQVQEMLESDEIRDGKGKENIDFDTLGLKPGTPWYSRPGPYEIFTIVAMITMMIWLW